jgi:DNA-binding CsgD family transcriptional regulator/ligand-binding sensor domain-containing protein
MFLRIQYIFKLILIFSSTILFSQEIPPLQNYTAETYNAENQNWAISQSDDNIIYAANSSGLLEFNGAKWNLYTSPNNSIIRSVKVIKNKIYTGCYMNFGYWEKDNSGHLQYISISNSIKLLEDEEFWNIVQLDEWVLFQSLNRIYIYNSIEKTFKIINSKTVLEKIFKVNNSIYYHKKNDGLYKIEKGNSLLISDNPIIKENLIVGVYMHNKNILLLTKENGFFKLRENKLTKWKTSSDSLLSTISVYSSVETRDGNFILGTISNGIFQLDNEGNTISKIDQENGLNNNTVLNIFEDRDKNIWLGLDNGISCLNFNSIFKVYYDKNGKLGTTYASITHKDYLYIGTNQGLFYKPNSTRSEFKLINGTEGQVWDLQVIDDTMFCGHDAGTYIIEKEKATLIATVPGTWKLEQYLDDKNTIIQGNYNGLSILKKRNNQWEYAHKINGFENSSRYFEVIDKNKILVTHEYKGIFELILNDSLTKFTNININTKLKGEKSSFVKYQNDFLYYFNKGIFRYNIDKNSFYADSFLTNSITKDETYKSGKLVNTNDGKLWVFTNKNVIIFSPGKLNTTPEINKVFLPVDLRKDYVGFENISLLFEEKYLLGTSFGYLVIDTEKINNKKQSIQLNSITKRKLNNAEKFIPLNNNNIFKYEYNNLNFSFSVPTYEKFTEVTYKYIIEGRHNHWTAWNKRPNASFDNLPFGKYTFKAKAKIGNSESINEISYSFEILRPWYLGNFYILMYCTLFLLIILIIHIANKRHYKKQKQILIHKKQQEFERSQLENERELMKLRNDKLRSDIDGKNRELAASTMSIIKKNEFLNSIKKELSEFENNTLIKPVIKIIDKNLNNTSDWKLFQEAFNNADKDFLIKVKDKYPILTPNDLRLCAYLRLNLSSKEIAPLLNISHKSVEIKRYRLRKKMGLAKKDNLIHHILEI